MRTALLEVRAPREGIDRESHLPFGVEKRVQMGGAVAAHQLQRAQRDLLQCVRPVFPVTPDLARSVPEDIRPARRELLQLGAGLLLLAGRVPAKRPVYPRTDPGGLGADRDFELVQRAFVLTLDSIEFA